LKGSGLTLLLAEQNQAVVLQLSDRGYVIDYGAIHYHGTRRDLAENEEVRRQYLTV
jgi:branched-chain amino acid transport system ATP-binding protein